jgi:hypothetical protein
MSNVDEICKAMPQHMTINLALKAVDQAHNSEISQATLNEVMTGLQKRMGLSMDAFLKTDADADDLMKLAYAKMSRRSFLVSSRARMLLVAQAYGMVIMVIASLLAPADFDGKVQIKFYYCGVALSRDDNNLGTFYTAFPCPTTV